LQNYDIDPHQKKYSNEDNCCILLVTTLLCCRGKLLAGCDKDDVSRVDVGCAVNCSGLDCSPAPEYGLCELFCPEQRRYSCPAPNYGIRSSSCVDADRCYFEQGVSIEQIQNSFPQANQRSTSAVME
jgi:hypothetical protein